jgi:hypothetical protein
MIIYYIILNKGSDMNKTISTMIKASLVAASLTSGVCRGTYGCLGDDVNDGTLPPPLQIIGQTPNGMPVHRNDGDGLVYAEFDGRWERVKNIGGRFLYGGYWVVHDGQGGFYDNQGTPLQSVGQIADGNLVYFSSYGHKFFTFKDNKLKWIIQLRNGHFAYNSCQYFFDGQNWVDIDGNVWEDGKGVLVDIDGRILR